MYIAPITSALKLLRQSLLDDVRTACERRKMHDARDKNAVSETMKMYERYIIVAKEILAVSAMDAFPLLLWRWWFGVGLALMAHVFDK